MGQMAAVASMGALEARAEAAVAAEETEVVTAAVRAPWWRRWR